MRRLVLELAAYGAGLLLLVGFVCWYLRVPNAPVMPPEHVTGGIRYDRTRWRYVGVVDCPEGTHYVIVPHLATNGVVVDCLLSAPTPASQPASQPASAASIDNGTRSVPFRWDWRRR